MGDSTRRRRERRDHFGRTKRTPCSRKCIVRYTTPTRLVGGVGLRPHTGSVPVHRGRTVKGGSSYVPTRTAPHTRCVSCRPGRPLLYFTTTARHSGRRSVRTRWVQKESIFVKLLPKTGKVDCLNRLSRREVKTVTSKLVVKECPTRPPLFPRSPKQGPDTKGSFLSKTQSTHKPAESPHVT